MTRLRGMTLIEVVVVLTILSILAAVAFPTARIASRRAKEIELRVSLREVRTAIDAYKAAADRGEIAKPAGASGYPPTLEALVDGVPVLGSLERRKFLRRIPRDPFGSEWGLRSYADPPDSTVWGGQDVYDVYSRAPGSALDGSAYASW